MKKINRANKIIIGIFVAICGIKILSTCATPIKLIQVRHTLHENRIVIGSDSINGDNNIYLMIEVDTLPENWRERPQGVILLKNVCSIDSNQFWIVAKSQEEKYLIYNRLNDNIYLKRNGTGFVKFFKKLGVNSDSFYLGCTTTTKETD